MTSKIRHKQLTDLEWVDSAHTGTPNKIAGFGVGGEAIYVDLRSEIPYDIDFEFADFVLGTAKTYTLDLKAKKAYTIEGIVLETDTGTLPGIAVKIGSTAVTSLSSLTATTIAETASTGAKTVALGDRVTFELSTGYTGTPTTVRGKLLRQLL